MVVCICIMYSYRRRRDGEHKEQQKQGEQDTYSSNNNKGTLSSRYFAKFTGGQLLAAATRCRAVVRSRRLGRKIFVIL